MSHKTITPNPMISPASWATRWNRILCLLRDRSLEAAAVFAVHLKVDTDAASKMIVDYPEGREGWARRAGQVDGLLEALSRLDDDSAPRILWRRETGGGLALTRADIMREREREARKLGAANVDARLADFIAARFGTCAGTRFDKADQVLVFDTVTGRDLGWLLRDAFLSKGGGR